MNIPKQFEYLHAYTQLQGLRQAPVFVTVLDAFEHHYTGTKMYHIRLEHDGTFGFKGSNPRPFVDYKTVTEDEMVAMLGLRIKGEGFWFTSPPNNRTNWVAGENEDGYTFGGLLFDEDDPLAINGGRVFELTIRNKDRECVMQFEQGVWFKKPATPETQKVFEEVLNFLEQTPPRCCGDGG